MVWYGYTCNHCGNRGGLEIRTIYPMICPVCGRGIWRLTWEPPQPAQQVQTPPGKKLDLEIQPDPQQKNAGEKRAHTTVCPDCRQTKDNRGFKKHAGSCRRKQQERQRQIGRGISTPPAPIVICRDAERIKIT